MTVECPHCHAQTELQPLAITPRKISRFLGFVLLGIAAALALLIFLKSRNAAPTTSQPPKQTNSVLAPPEAPRPKSLEDLQVIGPVSIEKAKNSRLSYAMGTLKNDSTHQRFGVKVEVELFDNAGNKLSATANDYVQTLAPREEWKFRALVLDAKAVTAKVASVKED